MDENTIKKLLGLRIKQLRKSMNFTQFVLGEKINLDQRQIAYIEGGNSFPTLKTLNKMCNIFDCQIKDLFDFEHLIQNENIKEKLLKKIKNLNDRQLNLCYQILNTIGNNT